MNELISKAAEEFAAAHTTPFDGALAAASNWTHANTSWPAMMAGVPEARLLEALIVASGARSVLELGTFTGVGALAMAAALPADGRVVTLEQDPDNAAAAQRHIAASPLADRIELIQGDARETLPRLPGPFDLVWIDPWKADYPRYLDLVVPKLTPRGIIVADNLFRDGAALPPATDDDATVAVVLERLRRTQDSGPIDRWPQICRWWTATKTNPLWLGRLPVARAFCAV